MIDTSNHKNLKIIPNLIRYFNSNFGTQIKNFEVKNLKGETTNILLNYVIESLKKHKLFHKIIAFSGDNCNTNFLGSGSMADAGQAARSYSMSTYIRIW